MRITLIPGALLALGFGKTVASPQGIVRAPARMTCPSLNTTVVTVTVVSFDTRHNSTPRPTPTVTVTIDSFGVPTHDSPGGYKAESGSSSQPTPLDYCGPASSVSSPSVSKVQNACSGSAQCTIFEASPPPGYGRGATSVITQQGVISSAKPSFIFPETPRAFYKRAWQPAPLHAPLGGSGFLSSSTFDANKTTAALPPSGSSSVAMTCACPLPAPDTSSTSSSMIDLGGVSIAPYGPLKTDTFTTSSPGVTMSSSVGIGISIIPSQSVNMSTPFATTGASITPSSNASMGAPGGTSIFAWPSWSANATTSYATGVSGPLSLSTEVGAPFEQTKISSKPSPSANMTTPFATTDISASWPSSNITTPLTTPGVSATLSPSVNVGASPATIDINPSPPGGILGAPPFTNATSGTHPTATNALTQLSSGMSSPISSVLSAPTSASINVSSSNVSEVASSASPTATSSDLSVSLTSAVPPSASSGTAEISPTAVCASSSSVGNMTFNFDDLPPGQLFNPYHGFWFSEGFIVTQDSGSPYRPASGNQMAEFIPASLSNGRFNSSQDLAMISVGERESNPCFRFNLYSLNLGCPTNLTTPCEFDIRGMRYDETAHRVEGTDTGQDINTVACNQTRCDLTLMHLDAYQNISSFIVKATSNNSTQIWWADDLVVGWTDNSCDAAECRERAGNITGKPELGRRLRL